MLSEYSALAMIFSTHESILLDQEIFRQDEIWFKRDRLGHFHFRKIEISKIKEFATPDYVFH